MASRSKPQVDGEGAIGQTDLSRRRGRGPLISLPALSLSWPGRVLILTSNETNARNLKASLESLCEMAVVVGAWPHDETLSLDAYDLIAIDVASGGEGLALGIRLLGRRSVTEIVFICEDAEAPEVAAARALGTKRVVIGPGASDWLTAAAPALVRAAQARRALRTAEAAVPPVPSRARETGPARPLPLPLAEGRFRETYLRTLLATSQSRAHAARQAGIPYRTLCRLLQSLNIRFE